MRARHCSLLAVKAPMAQNLTMRAILMPVGSPVDWPMGMASRRLGLLVSSHTPSLLPELMMEGGHSEWRGRHSRRFHSHFFR